MSSPGHRREEGGDEHGNDVAHICHKRKAHHPNSRKRARVHQLKRPEKKRTTGGKEWYMSSTGIEGKGEGGSCIGRRVRGKRWKDLREERAVRFVFADEEETVLT